MQTVITERMLYTQYLSHCQPNLIHVFLFFFVDIALFVEECVLKNICSRKIQFVLLYLQWAFFNSIWRTLTDLPKLYCATKMPWVRRLHLSREIRRPQTGRAWVRECGRGLGRFETGDVSGCVYGGKYFLLLPLYYDQSKWKDWRLRWVVKQMCHTGRSLGGPCKQCSLQLWLQWEGGRWEDWKEECVKQRHLDKTAVMEMVWKEAKERSAETKKIFSFYFP